MKKKYFAETDNKKRSFSNLAEAVDWVRNILTKSGYSEITLVVNSDRRNSLEGIDPDEVMFVEFRAVKDGDWWDAAIIENRDFD